MSERYKKSEALLERALGVIPLGTQTFSKSKTQYPLGAAPFFIERGKGSRVWDVDGHEYIDFVNGLAALTLGHCDPDVTAAVQAQLAQGTLFSLPHPLEIEVAEKVRELVPCAEMVRFGKNGSDATSGAIRLARAFTGRKRVAVCGYHGWQDWYIGSTSMRLGVPDDVSALTHAFSYNDLDSLAAVFEAHPNQIAAIILEPMNVTAPAAGFLEGAQGMARDRGALLIFDEMVTGFRFALGGAQERFGVTPDLAAFGKGIANGYPLSVVAGRADVMRFMEKIFFSFTFGGETLSLAAALATMRKMQTAGVLDHLKLMGEKVMAGARALIAKHGVGSCLSIAGDPSWSFLLFKDAAGYSSWQIKTLFLEEVLARGILTLGTHNMSYSHSEEDVDRLLAVYDEVFALISEALRTGTLSERLRSAPLEPLFKVR